MIISRFYTSTVMFVSGCLFLPYPCIPSPAGTIDLKRCFSWLERGVKRREGTSPPLLILFPLLYRRYLLDRLKVLYERGIQGVSLYLFYKQAINNKPLDNRTDVLI
jgi:hypothetical protein